MKRLGNEKNIFLATVFFAGIHIFRFYRRGYIEDPDIGSFVILSQHFWSGNIFYEEFFDPKLPHILPVYSLSFLSGSLAGHLIVTLCCIVATGFIINQSGRNVWGGVFYICLVMISPGGVTGHLAVFANFLVACGYFSLERYRKVRSARLYNYACIWWLLASAIFTGWAIGLRPNYGFALIPFSVWFIWQDKLSSRAALLWTLCCAATIIGPVILALQRAGISIIDFYEVFISWNKYFYSDVGLPGFFYKIFEMYSHPIGPFRIGILLVIIILSILFSTSKEYVAKVIPFSFALGFLWFSHFVSHTYNHYILMDLLVISLLISSVRIKGSPVLLLSLVASLWFVLLLSPINPNSNADSLVIENRRVIHAWITSTRPRDIVSPIWLTPIWTTKSSVPTKGIHPEWTIGLLDRYEFKKIPAVQRLGLNPTWESNCKAWRDHAVTLIASQEIYDRCSFQDFKEVSGFSKYPLKVWIKK